MLWNAFSNLLIAILKLCALLIAWCLKIVGSVILFFSSLIFKHAGK